MVENFDKMYKEFLVNKFKEYLSDFETTIDWGDIRIILSRGHRIPCSMHFILLKELESDGYLKIHNMTHKKVEILID